MRKIYIVKSSCGEYEDYRVYNEKAFISKEKAKEFAKELDKAHNYKPQFITPEFEKAYEDAESEVYNLMDTYPEYQFPVKNIEDYKKYCNEYESYYIKSIIDAMYKKGFFVTPEMINAYEAYISESQYAWYNSQIEELELCE